MSQLYGPFTSTVDLAGYAVGAALAISTTWLGKSKWHPTGELPERIAGLGTAIFLLLLLIAPLAVLWLIAVAGFIAAVVCGIFYNHYLHRWRVIVTQVVDIKIHGDKRDEVTKTHYYVAGTLVPTGDEAKLPPKDLLERYAYNLDSVWDPASRAKRVTVLASWYVPMVVAGSAALVAATKIYALLSAPAS